MEREGLDVIHSTLMSTTCVNSDPPKSARAIAEELEEHKVAAVTEFRRAPLVVAGSIRLVDALLDLGGAEYQSERNLHHWETRLLTTFQELRYLRHVASRESSSGVSSLTRDSCQRDDLSTPQRERGKVCVCRAQLRVAGASSRALSSLEDKLQHPEGSLIQQGAHLRGNRSSAGISPALTVERSDARVELRSRTTCHRSQHAAPMEFFQLLCSIGCCRRVSRLRRARQGRLIIHGRRLRN